jgi:hypothetical protein
MRLSKCSLRDIDDKILNVRYGLRFQPVNGLHSVVADHLLVT